MALTFTSTSTLSPVEDARLSRVEAALPRFTQGSRLVSSSTLAIPSANAVQTNGLISPTRGVANVGNAFPFIVQGNFAFVWDGYRLTAYWDGTNGSKAFVIGRSDGARQSIPTGSLAFDGLSPNTKYGFAPFIAISQSDKVSFAVGDTGSPRYAFSPSASATLLSMAAQTQKLSANEAITDGFVYFTTGASKVTTSNSGANANGNNPYTGNVPSDRQGYDPNTE